MNFGRRMWNRIGENEEVKKTGENEEVRTKR